MINFVKQKNDQMSINIIEIKARCEFPDKIHQILKEKNAVYKGIDHQVDTYFQTNNGRLKLRQGTIENTLIFYNRPDQEGPKLSKVLLHKPTEPDSLNKVLSAAMDVKVVVDKQRHIYFIDNVKFHVDEVKGLGSFAEIEAIDETGKISIDVLQKQCDAYMALLEIKQSDLIHYSYSDMLLTANS